MEVCKSNEIELPEPEWLVGVLSNWEILTTTTSTMLKQAETTN